VKKANIRLLVGALIVVVALGMYLFVDTVRFSEKAVITTFGEASQNAVRTQAGAFFKIPIVNSVTKYDTRARIVRTQSVQQQTADSRSLIVEAFCVWRVDDPLKFFKAFSNAGPRAVEHFRKAEAEVIRGNLRAALSEVGQYRMSELFAKNDSAIPELEASIRDALRSSGSADASESLKDKGIEVLYVGVSKMLLPQSTTQSVFQRMQASRAARVSALEARGRSEADAIIAKADADAQRIRQFALARAAEIKSRGDQEAQPWIAMLNENPELAVFLRNMDLVREMRAKQFTLVMPDNSPGLGVLAPKAGTTLRDKGIPGVQWVRTMFSDLSGSGASRGESSEPETGSPEAQAQNGETP
jgi:modulator of FtsH protease HflC